MKTIQASYQHTNGLYEFAIDIGHMTLAGLSNCPSVVSNKPIVLFLHGFLDNANSFSRLLSFMNSHSSHYQYLAIDHAGHGNSSHRSADAHYHLVDYAFDIHKLLLQLQAKSVVLVGHSLGAIVSSIFAATQPNNLHGFICIESCGPLSENEDITATQLKACFESRVKAESPIKQPQSFEQVVKARCLVSDFSMEDARTIMARNVKVLDNGECEWKTDKRLRTKSTLRMTESQSINILKNISCERMVILGENGFEKVKKGIEARAEHFNNVPIYTLPGGHHVHFTSEQAVADSIQTYVQKWIGY